MHNAQKQATSQSPLLSLIKQSVLLYGNRSLSFIQDREGALHPVKFDLGSVGVSFEMPRMQMVDPVGIDLTIRILRTEKMNEAPDL